MTANDLSIPSDVYQSFSQLIDSISDFVFIASLIPEGELSILITTLWGSFFVWCRIHFMFLLIFIFLFFLLHL